MAKEIVIHPKQPSGTLQTNTPIPKIIESTQLYPIAYLALKKNKIPNPIAIPVIIKTNLSSSILKGVLGVSLLLAKSAIYPKTVFLPISITMAYPEPSLQKVPKNAIFDVSSILSCVQFVVLDKGSVSPVKAELSTFISTD